MEMSIQAAFYGLVFTTDIPLHLAFNLHLLPNYDDVCNHNLP